MFWTALFLESGLEFFPIERRKIKVITTTNQKIGIYYEEQWELKV